MATFLSRFAPLAPDIGRVAQLWRLLLVVLMEWSSDAARWQQKMQKQQTAKSEN
jgi:hypothetical protein